MALRSGRVGIHPSQVDPITGMLLNGPTPGSISFEDLSDAQISNPEVGQTLIYNGEGWENEFSSISPTTLAALQDVQITDPEDGAILVYDSASGKWVNSVTPPAPVVPDGDTVTPTDDVETWLSCAGIDDKSYTTLSDILSDSITFNALLGDSNACKYMARSTTWASTLCAEQYAMNMIGQYDVCCDALLANATWNTAINNSPYWNGHTDSGEKIHGANEEVAYYLDGATQIPISDPSTLDAGTYTFGSTVAKNPDSLSSDYTKQIRITPNTVEVVLRPDNAIYWYGNEIVPMEFRTGSSTLSYVAGTVDKKTNSIDVYSSGTGNTYCCYATTQAVSGTKTRIIVNSAILPAYSAANTTNMCGYVNDTWDTSATYPTIVYASAISSPILIETSHSASNLLKAGMYMQHSSSGTANKTEIAALWRE